MTIPKIVPLQLTLLDGTVVRVGDTVRAKGEDGHVWFQDHECQLELRPRFKNEPARTCYICLVGIRAQYGYPAELWLFDAAHKVAKKFGVATSVISGIARGDHWNHVA